MKRIFEIACCDVCEERFDKIPMFWSQDDLHLCEECARRVLTNLALGPRTASVLHCKEVHEQCFIKKESIIDDTRD